MSSWNKWRPGGSKDPFRGAVNTFASAPSKITGSSAANLFSSASQYNPANIFDSTKLALQNPKEAMRFLEDKGKRDPLGALLGTDGGPIIDLSEGYVDAQQNQQDFNLLSDQDLYRKQSETSRPRDNPFEAQNFDQFSGVYDARHRPRVYATDNSFVYPDTEPVRPNTALIPSTAQPMVVGGNPMQAAPQFSPEVTAQTATPGYRGATPNAETVAKQFAIPNQPRRRSASTVR